MTDPTTTQPSSPFPRSTPETEGIPSSAILAFIDALEQHDHPLDSVHSLMLLRHGNVVAEGWWHPYRPAYPHMLYSLSKSFTSSAIGIAVAEGLLNLDDPVLKFFPDDAPANPGDNLKEMTVRHLLSMNTGHHEDTVGTVWGSDDDNWPRVFLSLPVQHQPGTWFVYNTAATYMLSIIIHRVTGEDLLDYLRPRLFEPLGIEQPSWDRDPHGHSIGGSGLHITTDAIARFGQMYLQKGEWNGRQILPETWVADATSAHSDNSNTQTNPDWIVGYGYQFWRSRHDAYRGDGAFGQYCLVLPEHDAVVAITSGVRDLQRILDCVWKHLLPAFGKTALPANTTAHTALTDKLASLALPVAQGASTSPLAETISNATWTLAPNDAGIDRIAFQFETDRAIITITDTNGEHRIAVGYNHWLDGESTGRIIEPGNPGSGNVGTERTSASGAWTDDDRFELRLCYTENEVCPILRFHFTDPTLSIEIDPNVSWTDPSITTLTAHR